MTRRGVATGVERVEKGGRVGVDGLNRKFLNQKNRI